ncbi:MULTISPECIES: DUF1173 domain-containing protein [unclassified Nocardioides]|uniref:DUF1173 domain-containing protein n=1 Tax=unclassified Nocardioides TaxID=2615069 RepID=UPI0009F151A5|nr:MULTISPECIES: DUF1173 domain-containing protein [unclassified Nocardioides]GAW47928.1 uncharacterized protein PD653B2_0239 [Nocardioides sp. PD653-B2]GAW53769.1 uncharacterized protein PD653_1172 [Nocardioides sp. PD653]
MTTTRGPAADRADPTTNRERDPAGDRQTFELYGHRISHTNNPETQQLLSAAHTDRVRPLCLCRPNGVAMYVAKIGPDKYVIKRMPDTGLAHTVRCASYPPPQALSGLGQVLGSAITEESDSGLTAIKLGFRMSKTERPTPASAGGGDAADSVAADPNRLTLRAVLHYLWQEADLATWSPGMDGKRNWRIVSWYLRQAARGKFTKGKPLAARLYIPEPFSVEKKTEIAVRRLTAWAPLQQHGSSQQFMMLIGELKEIAAARFGHKLVIKHLPDAPLMVDDTLLTRLNKRFGDELELWQANDQGHLMVIATFSVGRAGLTTAEEISLVMTDRNWLPYESLADKLLLDTALEARRRFTKSLRYNLAPDRPMASLVFTDTESPTAAFLLTNDHDRDAATQIAADTGTDVWTWVITSNMPVLPPAKSTAPFI